MGLKTALQWMPALPLGALLLYGSLCWAGAVHVVLLTC